MKFHKPLSLLLAFVLFVSNFGFAMNVHFCGGEIASVSFNPISAAIDAENNCCGIEEGRSHCCKNKVVFFEKKTDKATVFAFDFELQKFIVYKEWHPIFVGTVPFKAVTLNGLYSFQSNAPPLFKLHSQYIFYDHT